MVKKYSVHGLFKKGLLIMVLLNSLVFMSCSSKCHSSKDNIKYDDHFQSSLAGITVRNLDGEDVELESLWSDRRVILTFFRHYG